MHLVKKHFQRLVIGLSLMMALGSFTAIAQDEPVEVELSLGEVTFYAELVDDIEMNVRIADPNGQVLVDAQSLGEPVTWSVPVDAEDGLYNYDAEITGTASGRTHGQFVIEGGQIQISTDADPAEGGYLEQSLWERTSLDRLAGAVLDLLVPQAQAVDLTISDNTPEIDFDDTDSAASDWRIFVNNNFASGIWRLFDGGSNTVFDLRKSGNNDGSLLLDTNGDFTFANGAVFIDRSADRLGIGTTTPGVTVDAAGNRIRLRSGSKSISMRVDGAETDLEAINGSLFIRSSTVGENVVINPFGSDGNVGIGTSTPANKLHVLGSTNGQILVENTNAAAGADRVMFRLQDASINKIRFAITSLVHSWTFDNAGTSFQINKVGTGLNEFRFDQNGDSAQRGRSFAVNHINTSSREYKTDFEPVDEKKVLEKLVTMPLSTWRYKTGGVESRHLGPVAEDFQQAFGLSDGKHISTVDASGVALAAIKGLTQIVQQKESELVALRKANDELSERIARLEQLLLGDSEVSSR